MASSRYEIIMDPSGRYTVWDIQEKSPASIGGSLLFGISEIKAAAALSVLRGMEDIERSDPSKKTRRA